MIVFSPFVLAAVARSASQQALSRNSSDQQLLSTPATTATTASVTPIQSPIRGSFPTTPPPTYESLTSVIHSPGDH
jgi:hypothetical protein